MYADSLKRKDDFTGDVRIMISIFVAHQWRTLGGGGTMAPNILEDNSLLF